MPMNTDAVADDPPPAGLSDRWPASLLSRIEDAGLNASAPPQQRWMDGWIVRTSPGKARRARCWMQLMLLLMQQWLPAPCRR